MTDTNEYLDLGQTITLGGKEYKIRNPGIKSLPDKFKVIEAMSDLVEGKNAEDIANQKLEDIDITKFMKALSGEAIQSLANLIEASLKRSYPDWSEDAIESFGYEYMMELMPIMLSNSNDAKDTSKQKLDVVNRLNNQTK